MIRFVLVLSLGSWIAWATAARGDEIPPPLERRVDFETEIRPLLTARCLACHGPDKQRGGLRLDRKNAAMEGGYEGDDIIPGDGAESLVVRLTAGAEEDRLMPPKGARLSNEQVALLRTWIDQGADWPGGDEDDDPRNWWSLRPLALAEVPVIEPFADADAPPARNPIDAFIRAKLREKGLGPSPEADRRTLIRRLSFDLVGLPPTPEEITAFVDDPDPLAYEKLVDRLLASPRYGERWARHWLDAAHYGDSHGYDKDKPRPNAWPYRDYVIRSFNADKSYGRFVAEQVAGDVLYPDEPDGVVALGFLASGPWDFVGHAEVPETKIDGQIARHLDRDDMVAVTINTFLGLTAQCAQCHDHKFDPISQEDYYRLQAVFAAVDRADRPYYDDPEIAREARELTALRDQRENERKRVEALIEDRAGPALAELDRRIAEAQEPPDRPEHGYHSALAIDAGEVKWVQVDLGRSAAIDRVVLWGCFDSFNDIGPGFGFPVRFKIEASDDPTFERETVVIADRTEADEPNPGVAPQTFQAQGARGRYVRLTAPRLAERFNDHVLAMAELEVFDEAGANLAAGAPVSALDSIEAGPRWRLSNLVDGHAPGRDRPDELAKLQADRAELLASAVDPSDLRTLEEIQESLRRIEARIADLPEPSLVYAATIYDGGDAPFRGTGPDGGRPRPIHVLFRGDVKSPRKEVGPAALEVFTELPGAFDLSPDQPEGERRAALARWLSDRRNPLVWRTIVNRVWQHHFGNGIVATSGDFGRMGEPATHPELLDWLAVGFRDGGQSLKDLHRLIVTSSTYRQSSAGNPEFEAIDAGDAYLWRAPRRKLEAEAIRDAAIFVAGRLDPTMYGPAFQDFVIERPEHSPQYQYDLQPPDDPKIHRRAIYRFLVRSKLQPFMTALDCADPSMRVDKRNETASPLQALALYNNGLMLTMAKHLADRVEPAGDRRAQLARAFALALGREPSTEELSTLDAHAAEFGLPSACRVILNLNEFMFID